MAATCAPGNKVDAWRDEQYPSLISYHDRMSAYMSVLAVLAGEETYNLTKELDGVAKAFKKPPQDLPPDKKKDFKLS